MGRPDIRAIDRSILLGRFDPERHRTISSMRLVSFASSRGRRGYAPPLGKPKSTFSPLNPTKIRQQSYSRPIHGVAKNAIVPWRFGKQDDPMCPAQTVQRSRLRSTRSTVSPNSLKSCGDWGRNVQAHLGLMWGRGYRVAAH
jgi:hypothetical protein